MVDEQDRLLPIANVGRIMKQVLPPTAKISKEAKETMQECATEFISFVTGEASDKCHKENRKTVNADDICWALSSLGFDNYAVVLVRYLHKLREAERERAISNNNNNNDINNNQNKAAVAAAASSAAAAPSSPDIHQDKDVGFGFLNFRISQPDKQINTTNLLEFRVLDKGNSSSSSFSRPA